MAISRHTDLKKVEKHMKAPNRKRLAKNAMKRLTEMGSSGDESG
jgi:hypothetical protein